MVSVDFAGCFAAALMLLILPLNWLSAAFFAALFHELCHCAAIYLSGGGVQKISIGAGGAVIETTQMEPANELVCALAGPVGSFLLLLASGWFPRLAICGCIQGLFNLLPVFPLDGGRAVECLLRLVCPKQGRRIAYVLEKAAILGICFLSFMLTFWYRLGILPVLAALVLILKLIGRKIPCKPTRIGVQ